MTVSSVISVFIIDASLLAIPTMIVVPVNRVATTPARILASKILVDRTLCAPFRIIEQHVLASPEWYRVQLQQSDVCEHLH